MSSLVFSIPSAPAAANAAGASTAASSSARGRDAQSPTDTEAFGAALARSRDSRSRQTEDKAEPASGTPATRRRAPASAEQREDASPAELLAMAMLTPAFSMQAAPQQGRAAAQGGELAAQVAMDGTAAGAAEQPLAGTDGNATDADARAPAQESTATSTAAAQAAGAQSEALQDKDAKSAKAKAKTLSAPDAKASTPTTPVAEAPATPGAATAAAPATASATPATAATAAKDTLDPAALALQASNGAKAEHQPETESDSPALLPGVLNFKTALAEASTATTTAAQAQAMPRFAVPTPVGSEGWGADIGTQMIRMGANGHHVAELSLNPAGLGPLKVTLTLGDNQAQAMFVSAHESVRRAVEAALPQLRDTLAGQGIQLGQASVDAGTQQQQAFSQERDFEAPARPGLRSSQQATAVEAEPVRTATRGRSASAIDTFA